MKRKTDVMVIGAGLAGVECAFRLAERGLQVKLVDMKPKKKSPAHHSDLFGELVCSNSLKGADVTNACGLLKEEMRRLGSLTMRAAEESRVDAGGALAVDRDLFAGAITREIQNHKNIEIVCEEVTNIDLDEWTVIATGPLTSDALSLEIARITGSEHLHFYDAAAPIVFRDSLDEKHYFIGDRYGKGNGDYVNCPMNKEEYDTFYEALTSAERVILKDFEKGDVFESCMPIESMATRGKETLRFGPMKPVGLRDPRDGKRPYAVLQLRSENADKSLLNLVGFQTNLTFPEQKRVFSMIPALANAQYARYGVMHRNTFLNAPKILEHGVRLRGTKKVFFAGQITGVEGYVESACSGIVAAIQLLRVWEEKDFVDFTQKTMCGAIIAYIDQHSGVDFQPMNANFGIIQPIENPPRDKKEKYARYAERALKTIEQVKAEFDL